MGATYHIAGSRYQAGESRIHRPSEGIRVSQQDQPLPVEPGHVMTRKKWEELQQK